MLSSSEKRDNSVYDATDDILIPVADRSCQLSSRFLRFPDKRQCSILPFTTEEFVPLAFKIVVVHKKHQQLVYKLVRKVFEFLDVVVHVIGLGDDHKPIVAAEDVRTAGSETPLHREFFAQDFA